MSSMSLRSRKKKKYKMKSNGGSKSENRVIFEQEYKIKLRKQTLKGKQYSGCSREWGGGGPQEMSVDLNVTILVMVTCQELLSVVTKNDSRNIFA